MKTETAQSTSAQNDEEDDAFFDIAGSFKERIEIEETQEETKEPAKVGGGLKRQGSRHDLQK